MSVLTGCFRYLKKNGGLLILCAVLLAFAGTRIGGDVHARSGAMPAKNIIAFGNSYSYFNGGWDIWLSLIAQEAGHAAPNIVKRFTPNATLLDHVNQHSSLINSALPVGQTWDAMVAQGMSVEATSFPTYGNPAQFRAAAVTLGQILNNHSPNARAVLFETWARGAGHSFYPTYWSGPLEMRNEIHPNYKLAVSDINTAVGSNIAERAAVGEAFAISGWDPSLYNADKAHPGRPGTILIAMEVFASVYGELMCPINPDFSSTTSPLVQRLNLWGITESVWDDLSGLADRTADLKNRHLPGSDDDFVLRTGVNGPANHCSEKALTAGSTLTLEFESPMGTMNGQGVLVLIQFYATGIPPQGPPQFPEVQFGGGFPIFELHCIPALQPGSNVLTIPLGASFPGASVRVQAFGTAPSVGPSFFTTTDAQDLHFQ